LASLLALAVLMLNECACYAAANRRMSQISISSLSQTQILAGYIIFLASYVVFALGKFPGLKIDRTGAAIVGAVAMVAFRIVPPQEALLSIDFSTVVLLFSMMLVVASLRLAGFFEWTAQLVLRRLKPRYLLPALIFTCGFLSAFFVNDIVCLVMVPFVLKVTRRGGLAPLPYLLAVATASNVGSVATITGNPQNMLIGSFSGIHYRDFLQHLGPVALIGLFLDWAILHWLFAGKDKAHAQATEIFPLPAIEVSRLAKPAVVAFLVVIGFFLGVPPAMMAALGAAALLITRTVEPRSLYQEVDWGLLVFFVGLFLIVGGAERAGIVNHLLDLARHWDLQKIGTFTAMVGLVSNVVSNVPAVMVLKSLVPGFVNPHTAWLDLAMASTLAGNLTITGSVANIIVIETAGPEVRISFWDYVRVGVPITLSTMFVGWIWLTFMN
jgi:Na+/H+ antiporter NhaD/arsenite permease-like protein